MAEHMTFNHGVRSSTLRWVTKKAEIRTCSDLGFFDVPRYESSSANFRLRKLCQGVRRGRQRRFAVFARTREFRLSDEDFAELVRISVFLTFRVTSRALQISACGNYAKACDGGAMANLKLSNGGLQFWNFQKKFQFFKNLLTKPILRDMMYCVTGGMLWTFK